MGPKVILVEPKAYGKIDIDETQLADLDFFGRPVLTIERDLELVKQVVKTRKPVQYGKKVIVKKMNNDGVEIIKLKKGGINGKPRKSNTERKPNAE